jgi:hypothetical protein
MIMQNILRALPFVYEKKRWKRRQQTMLEKQKLINRDYLQWEMMSSFMTQILVPPWSEICGCVDGVA